MSLLSISGKCRGAIILESTNAFYFVLLLRPHHIVLPSSTDGSLDAPSSLLFSFSSEKEESTNH